MKLALKIDVWTLRGVREGVPALVELLGRHGAGATFFFAFGPDRRYGPMLPGRDLGRAGGAIMRGVLDAGHEAGVSAWNARAWRRRATHADAPWTEATMQQAVDAYAQVFGAAPQAHAAAGWQTNVHALRLTQRLGFAYCSDGRGHSPHLPVGNAELIRCPQFPTTLPLLDECLATPGVTPETLASHLLAITGASETVDHVFGLRADVDASLLRIVEQLLIGWKAQAYELVPLAALLESVEPLALPRCEVALAPFAGRRRPVLQQGVEFLGDVELPRAA